MIISFHGTEVAGCSLETHGDRDVIVYQGARPTGQDVATEGLWRELGRPDLGNGKPLQEEILSLATRLGPLFGAGGGQAEPEPLLRWKQELYKLAMARRVHDLIAEEREARREHSEGLSDDRAPEDKLATFFQWVQPFRNTPPAPRLVGVNTIGEDAHWLLKYRPAPPGLSWLVGPIQEHQVPPGTEPPDILPLADGWLLSLINRQLVHLECRTKLLYRSWESQSYEMSWVPPTLIGAIWCQLALDVHERRRWRDCEACERPFEILGTNEARSNKRVCSNKRCQKKLETERKRRARRLHRDGLNAEAIARYTPCKLTTARRWKKEFSSKKRRGRPRKEAASGT